MKKIIAVMLFIYIVSACSKGWFMDEHLTLNKQNYDGLELKTNGYYIEYTYGYTLILWKNGVCLGGRSDTSDIELLEAKFLDGSYYKTAKEKKSGWGLFSVEGSNLKFEEFIKFENIRQFVYLHNCIILNDSTLKVETIERSNKRKDKDKEKSELSFIYHFKPFSPKPDSTNKFTE